MVTSGAPNSGGCMMPPIMSTCGSGSSGTSASSAAIGKGSAGTCTPAATIYCTGKTTQRLLCLVRPCAVHT